MQSMREQVRSGKMTCDVALQTLRLSENETPGARSWFHNHAKVDWKVRAEREAAAAKKAEAAKRTQETRQGK